MSLPERLGVLHLIPTFGPGGAEQMASHLMAGLSESCEVTGVGLYPAFNTSIEDRLRRANIPLWHLDKRPGFDLKMFSSLDRVLREVRPHVVHTHLSVLRYLLPVLTWRRVPLVVHTLHSMAEHEADTLGRAVQWVGFRRAVVPVAISREVATSFSRVYGIDCPAIVPNCIPVESYRGTNGACLRWRLQEGFDRDAILFTCAARIEAVKAPLVLAEAFAALDDPRAHLIMLGDGSLRPQLAAFVREHGLQHRVHLLGQRDDVRECLAASDVFVLSSNWEGSPLSVMEAMAAGLPVVATAVGGVPELVESGRHGILVPPGQCAAFTGAMRTLLDNPGLRADMGKAGRSRANAEFSVERMVQGYANLYREQLGLACRETSAACAH